MKALIFDTETTGLIANHSVKLASQPHVIEFAAELIDFDTGEILNEYDQLIAPPIAITEEITKITTITDEDVKDRPKFPAVADAIKTMLETAPLIIGQNLSFDREMIDIEFERLQQKIAWPNGLCLVESTVGLKGYRLNLSDLHRELFGLAFDGAHRAKADAAATRRCAIELYKRGYI